MSLSHRTRYLGEWGVPTLVSPQVLGLAFRPLCELAVNLALGPSSGLKKTPQRFTQFQASGSYASDCSCRVMLVLGGTVQLRKSCRIVLAAVAVSSRLRPTGRASQITPITTMSPVTGPGTASGRATQYSHCTEMAATSSHNRRSFGSRGLLSFS